MSSSLAAQTLKRIRNEIVAKIFWHVTLWLVINVKPHRTCIPQAPESSCELILAPKQKRTTDYPVLQELQEIRHPLTT